MSETMDKSESSEDNEPPERCLKPRISCPPSKFNEANKWTFEETSALMDIWSRIDNKKYETKSARYRHISDQMSKQGFDRNITQIRCKIQRLTSKITEKPAKESRPQKPVERPKRPPVRQMQTIPAPRPKKEIDFDEQVFIGRYNYLTMDLLPPEETSNSSYLDDSSHESRSSHSVSSDSESEVDIGYEIVLTEPELDSEDSVFGSPIIEEKQSQDNQTCSTSTSGLISDTSGQKPEQQLISAIQDVKSEASDCFQDIITAQQQLKNSIKHFNQQLCRLTQSVVNADNDNNIIGNINNSQSVKRNQLNQSIKLVIPNLNNKLGRDFTS